ncbi:alpha/beta hydrolase [Galbibacter sp. EGI 63066]|uniref:alpha/beta hydrolase n=1 Tax=Galbibacter sp. EGI 63066 TaxID=2993559 RepID=UPI002248E50B|nr:alpha/beta hydrolase [Galbibacter sp. EGI 63066]MCX2680008.1 alpha/beta hydrolase [Galbibacter sp. EGI 63066]
MNSYKYISLFLILLSVNHVLFAQEKLNPSPYTIETTYQKLKKDHPFIKPVQELVSEEIKAKEDVTYRKVNSVTLKADVYRPSKKRRGGYPAVILVHGGGWASGSKENERVMAQHLAQNGYVGVSVAYRLSEVAKYPAAVQDIKASIRWLRKNARKYNIDADRIAILGASAGAQLATLIGVTSNDPMFSEGGTKYSDEVQAIVNVDGIVSFIHPEAEEGKYAAYWLGGGKETNFITWKVASPLEYVDENTPPTLFINSAQPRFHAGRDDMIAILDANNIYSEVHTIPESPHSFWLMHPWFEVTLNFTLDFLDKTLGER